MVSTAEQCFLSLEGDRAEALGWSGGVTPGQLEALCDLHRGVPEVPAVWRAMAVESGKRWVSQTVSRLSAPGKACVHALLVDGEVDALALCAHPQTFETFCLAPGPDLPLRSLPAASVDPDALKTLRLVGDRSRLAFLIEAAIQASSAQPLWLAPAASEAPLFWYQALSLCLPTAWRNAITFSTREAPRDAMPYAWIGGTDGGRGLTFRLLDGERPTGQLSRWATAVAELILEGDLAAVTRAVDAVPDRPGVARTALLEEAAQTLAASPQEALLEAARTARGATA